MSVSTPAEKLCTTCEKNPPARDSTKCKECLAAYQREYQSSKVGRAEKAGWDRGVRAMRHFLAGRFGEYRSNFAADEIARIILECDAPEFEEIA